MKTSPARHTGFCLLLWLCCAQARAQFAIDWFTLDGGGGTSTGGVFSVSGTVGQPDANSPPMTGGAFSLTGGFWSLFSTVQTPGAPTLSILLTPTNTAMVYWPYPSTGFNLQQHTNLITTNWIAATGTVTNNGVINYLIVNPPAGNRFYRLSKP